MRDRSPLRIAPGREGVSIWCEELFADATGDKARTFIGRAFALSDVAAVELRPDAFFGRVRYGRTTAPENVWRRLAQALKGAARPVGDAAALHLDWPGAEKITIHRIDGALTTWSLRHCGGGRVRLYHAALRGRADLGFRLEEELAPLVGVATVSTTPLLGELTVRFDPDALRLDSLVRELERAWPRVLDGTQAPPSARRLVGATGLLGVSAVGQFLAPQLLPVAMLGLLLYGLPNILSFLRQARSRRVGLPAIYAVALVLAMLRGRPFHSSIMALLLQLWPRLAFRAFSGSQRRLFAGVRRRTATARIRAEAGAEITLDIDALEPGDLVVVRPGEVVPVDGIVTEGLALVDDAVLTGRGASDKGPGDRVHAASLVRDGALVIRAERVGQETSAATIAATLPMAQFEGLPSSAQVERIGNRNAKPSLVAAAVGLAVTRQLHVGQVILRPDFVTAPRFGAQLAALQDIAQGLAHGFFFRDPGTIDKLAATDIYVFDDSAALDTRRADVAEVVAADGVAADLVIALAAAAYPEGADERGDALGEECADRDLDPASAHERTVRAGAVSLHDAEGHGVDVLTPAQLASAGLNVPPRLARAFAESRHSGVAAPRRRPRATGPAPDADGRLRPLWVVRSGTVIGFVTFRDRGAWTGTALVAALRARAPRARFIYLSSRPQAEAEALAARAGIAEVHGGLDADAKAEALDALGPRTLWIGDGTDPQAAAAIAAAGVSVSLAGAAQVPHDRADVVVLSGGLRRVELLRRLVSAHHARIAVDYRVVYGFNLGALALGLALGVPSYGVGLLGMGASAVLLARYSGDLATLADRLEAREQGRAEGVADGVFAAVNAPEPEDVELPADLAETGSGEAADLGDAGAV